MTGSWGLSPPSLDKRQVTSLVASSAQGWQIPTHVDIHTYQFKATTYCVCGLWEEAWVPGGSKLQANTKTIQYDVMQYGIIQNYTIRCNTKRSIVYQVIRNKTKNNIGWWVWGILQTVMFTRNTYYKQCNGWFRSVQTQTWTVFCCSEPVLHLCRLSWAEYWCHSGIRGGISILLCLESSSC